jgi:hypothetical protein
MTEAEWLACTDPRPMLESLRGKARNRKLRLFASACCRRIWPLLTDERSQRGVEVGERYVDGLASEEERAIASEEAGAAAAAACRIESGRLSNAGVYAYPAHYVGWFAASATSYVPDYGSLRTPDSVAASAAESAALASAVANTEAASQAALLRDIFGNLFRCSPRLPAAVLAWNDHTVPRIAQGIYEERQLPAGTLDTTRLAILADALLDAGCDNEELMAHCRNKGPHVRGCWAIDLILDKK